MFKKKKIGAPAVKKTLFEKGVNKILLQKKFFSRKKEIEKKKRDSKVIKLFLKEKK